MRWLWSAGEVRRSVAWRRRGIIGSLAEQAGVKGGIEFHDVFAFGSTNYFLVAHESHEFSWAKKRFVGKKNLVGIINLSLHEISLARQFLLDIFEGGRISTNSPLS